MRYSHSLPEFEPEAILDVLRYTQRRNHAAYLSHRKRRLRELTLFEAVA